MIRTPMDDVLAGGSLAGDGIINAYMVNLPTALLRPLDKKDRTYRRWRPSRIAEMQLWWKEWRDEPSRQNK